MVRVEVKPGKVRPYKNTNLWWEVLSMQLCPTQAGVLVLGNSVMELIWYSRAPPGDNCIFCIRTLKLMSSLCPTLLNVSAPTYTISIKRSTSHAGVVRQSLVPGLIPRRDFGQWTLDGTRHLQGHPSSVSSSLSLHKAGNEWPLKAQITVGHKGHAEGGKSYESKAVWRHTILPGKLNGFGPEGQYSHHRRESIALLHHIYPGTVGSWQGMGGVSHAGCASAGASPRSCHLWGDGLHRWSNGQTGLPWLSAISETSIGFTRKQGLKAFVFESA